MGKSWSWYQWLVVGWIVCLLLFFLGNQASLLLVRYFDVDEFAHLHWAARTTAGAVPYRDFMTFFPPGFYWLFGPILRLHWGTVEALLAARVAAFGIFCALVAATASLAWQLRGSLVAAVSAAAILVFLPMPADKFLEIRPDTLAMVLFVVGLSTLLFGIGRKGKGIFLISGAVFGASLAVLTKGIPLVALVGVWVAWWSWRHRSGHTFFWFIVGLGAPLVAGVLWLLGQGMVSTAFYQLVTFPVEANRLGDLFPLRPDLFFNPNGIYYGTNGWGREIITNHVFWLVGLVVGMYRLLTPSLAPAGRQAGTFILWRELLVGSVFFLAVALYVAVVPLKHTQYLVAIAPFIALYAADGVDMLWRHTQYRLWQRVAGVALFFIAGFFLVTVHQSITANKRMFTNTADLAQLATIYRTIPPNSYVLDMEGRTVFYRDPYPICCIPFGQFLPYLSRKLPSLANALEATHTMYIYQGKLDRINTLPAQDVAYIRRNYQPLPGDPQVLVHK
ncbi:hypothetical protein HY086_03815 [Candidatus Gottesmanbacteria bacterium]|nr:hypothetical protein [Candidatus Gottesmanbacteria bacterium]